MNTTLSIITILDFKAVTFLEPSLFMLVLGILGREGSSWHEMGMWRDSVEPAN